MDGLTLKLRRVGADVKSQDVAREMGVSKGRISRIEGQRVVSEDAESRYLAALAMCIKKSKSEAA